MIDQVLEIALHPPVEKKRSKGGHSKVQAKAHEDAGEQEVEKEE